MNLQLNKARAAVAALRTSAAGRSSLRNAFYGAAEYVAMPVTMLLATPFLLHRLGVASYGLWMLTTAAITSSSFISTGFGDAALKYAAAYRGQSDHKRLEDTLRVSLTINLVLEAHWHCSCGIWPRWQFDSSSRWIELCMQAPWWSSALQHSCS